jgi:hypothetical protein
LTVGDELDQAGVEVVEVLAEFVEAGHGTAGRGLRGGASARVL